MLCKIFSALEYFLKQGNSFVDGWYTSLNLSPKRCCKLSFSGVLLSTMSYWN